MAGGAYTLIRDTKEGDIVRIDFIWSMEKGDITEFSINISLLEGDRTADVYRVDTKHGYLHEHRFWRSQKPEGLNMGYKKAFMEKKEEALKNYEKWIMLFKQNRGETYGQDK